MKAILVFASLLFAICSSGFDEPVISISKTFSDAQINDVKQQVLHRYGEKIEVRVISRNAKNEIANLEFFRYQKDGKRGGGCSSDKFGLLIITKNGCSIADVGHEKNIKP